MSRANVSSRERPAALSADSPQGSSPCPPSASLGSAAAVLSRNAQGVGQQNLMSSGGDGLKASISAVPHGPCHRCCVRVRVQERKGGW